MRPRLSKLRKSRRACRSWSVPRKRPSNRGDVHVRRGVLESRMRNLRNRISRLERPLLVKAEVILREAVARVMYRMSAPELLVLEKAQYAHQHGRQLTEAQSAAAATFTAAVEQELARKKAQAYQHGRQVREAESAEEAAHTAAVVQELARVGWPSKQTRVSAIEKIR